MQNTFPTKQSLWQALKDLDFLSQFFSWFFMLLTRLSEPLMLLSTLYIVAETGVPVIPTCTLRGHSKMGKIGHGVKKLRVVLKSLQLVTKGINHGIKGGKDTVRKSFFP